MKVATVNKDICIGCGACTGISEVFKIEDDGLAAAVINPIEGEHEEEAIEASECCPTGAISIKENTEED